MKPTRLIVFALIPLAAASCVSTKKFKAMESAANSYAAAIDDVREENSLLAARASVLEDELAAAKAHVVALTDSNDALNQALSAKRSELRNLINTLNEEKNRLQRRIDELDAARARIEAEKTAELDRMKAAHTALVGELEQEIEQGQVAITQMQGKLSLNVAEKIFFESGSATLKPEGQSVLKKVGGILRKIEDKAIRVEGHTDNVPIGGALRTTFPTNWELSAARALTVVRFLENEAGVPANLLSAAAFAETQPVASNETTEGRAKNRRIEIAIVDKEIATAAKAGATAPEKAKESGEPKK